MKKIALGAILGASLMVSSSAFALSSMTADSMKSATGQAGVSIAIDNVVIEQYVGSTTYTDDDGVLGAAGSIVIGEKHTVKNFDAMTSAADFQQSFGEAMGWTWNSGTSTWSKAGQANVSGLDGLVKADWNKAAALTIDVGECTVLADGLNDNVNNLTATERTGITGIYRAQLAIPNSLEAQYTNYLATPGAAQISFDTWNTAYPSNTDVQNAALLVYNNQNPSATLSNTAELVATVGLDGVRNLAALGYAALNKAEVLSYVTEAEKVAASQALVTAGLADNVSDGKINLYAAREDYSTQKVTGVVIGLPTLLITTSADSYSVGVKMDGAINDGTDFIKISKEGSTMAILGGTIEIAAH